MGSIIGRMVAGTFGPVGKLEPLDADELAQLRILSVAWHSWDVCLNCGIRMESVGGPVVGAPMPDGEYSACLCDSCARELRPDLAAWLPRLRGRA